VSAGLAISNWQTLLLLSHSTRASIPMVKQ
jgi:hypothetical protein